MFTQTSSSQAGAFVVSWRLAVRLRAQLALVVPVALSLFFARDSRALRPLPGRQCIVTPFVEAARSARLDSWTAKLSPVVVTNLTTHETTPLRLYTMDGAVDPAARQEFERIASKYAEPHALSERLEQLVFKAAYHFGGASVQIVSGWRSHARRHSSGEALDFKLQGVYAGALAAYLRGLPLVGVGIYTHPQTQFVHLDVREQSYHWIDASPPGISWRERPLANPRRDERDAQWTPENDLPL
jgi:uncharacterized protein YcbK (DUF882 family)